MLEAAHRSPRHYLIIGVWSSMKPAMQGAGPIYFLFAGIQG